MINWYLSIRDILFYRVFGGISLSSSNNKKKYILNIFSSCADVSWKEYWWSYALYILWCFTRMKVGTCDYLWFSTLSPTSQWNFPHTTMRDVIYLMNDRSYSCDHGTRTDKEIQTQGNSTLVRYHPCYGPIWYHAGKDRKLSQSRTVWYCSIRLVATSVISIIFIAQWSLNIPCVFTGRYIS